MVGRPQSSGRSAPDHSKDPTCPTLGHPARSNGFAAYAARSNFGAIARGIETLEDGALGRPDVLSSPRLNTGRFSKTRLAQRRVAMAIVFSHVHFCPKCDELWTCVCWSCYGDWDDRTCDRCREVQGHSLELRRESRPTPRAKADRLHRGHISTAVLALDLTLVPEFLLGT
jgi:hypothetical protein